jgi:hypothetical protein
MCITHRIIEFLDFIHRPTEFPPHLRTETDPISETLCFLVSRILDDGQSPKTQ